MTRENLLRQIASLQTQLDEMDKNTGVCLWEHVPDGRREGLLRASGTRLATTEAERRRRLCVR